MDEIKAELSARLPSGVAFEIPLFGGIPVPQSTVMTWIIIGVITVLCIWLTHNLKERPGRVYRHLRSAHRHPADLHELMGGGTGWVS